MRRTVLALLTVMLAANSAHAELRHVEITTLGMD
jgi:hypothetical protein